jgi:hypothetical protein
VPPLAPPRASSSCPFFHIIHRPVFLSLLLGEFSYVGSCPVRAKLSSSSSSQDQNPILVIIFFFFFSMSAAAVVLP